LRGALQELLTVHDHPVRRNLKVIRAKRRPYGASRHTEHLLVSELASAHDSSIIPLLTSPRPPKRSRRPSVAHVHAPSSASLASPKSRNPIAGRRSGDRSVIVRLMCELATPNRLRRRPRRVARLEKLEHRRACSESFVDPPP